MFRNLTRLLRELNRLNQTGTAWAEALRVQIFSLLRWVIIGTLGLGTFFNLVGPKEVNYLLGLGAIIAIAYHATNSRLLVALAEGGWLYGALVVGIGATEAAKNLLVAYKNFVFDVLLAVAITFFLLGAIPLAENPWALPIGIFLFLTGWLILWKLEVPGKFALKMIFWLVVIVGIFTALSLIPASTWVQYTGHDLGAFFRHDAVLEAAQGVLDADNARQEKAKVEEIKRLQKKARITGLTAQERAELEKLIKERSSPGKILSAVKGRQPVTVPVPLSLTGTTVRLPEGLTGVYSIAVPGGTRIPFKCPGDVRGELLPGGVKLASGREFNRGELLLNGVRPWETIRLGGELSLDARLALDLVNNQCPGMVVTGSLPTISVTLTPVGS